MQIRRTVLRTLKSGLPSTSRQNQPVLRGVQLRYAMEAAKLPPRDEPMFVPVVGGSSPSSSDSIEVEVGGAVVRIGQAARTDLAVAIIQALQAGAG